MDPYQILGILSFVFAIVFFIVGFVFPDAYTLLDSLDEAMDEGEKPDFPLKMKDEVEEVYLVLVSGKREGNIIRSSGR